MKVSFISFMLYLFIYCIKYISFYHEYIVFYYIYIAISLFHITNIRNFDLCRIIYDATLKLLSF